MTSANLLVPQVTSDEQSVDVSLLLHALGLDHLPTDEDAALTAFDAKKRKLQGIFFTPPNLANKVLRDIGKNWSSEKVLDPACGSGNLLLEIAKLLPLSDTLESTLHLWNSHLYGLDINPEFVELARKKMVRAAILRGVCKTNASDLSELTEIFNNLKVGNFLERAIDYKGEICSVIMNPPFSSIVTPDGIRWTSGKSNAAASFVYYAAQIISSSGTLVAILPDVLRGGSRYQKWRGVIAELLDYEIASLGEFEKGVDVDVFTMTASVRKFHLKSVTAKQLENGEEFVLLQDEFNVSVGPVVPHRDERAGVEAPYAHAKTLPAWGVVELLSERICHSGKKVVGPFVAIRRTSSPRDKYRATASIVNCDEPVAAENHIIIASPLDGKLKTCELLLHLLRSDEVNAYINGLSRCRHLTVGIIKNIRLRRK